jgi:hypothetical protein
MASKDLDLEDLINLNFNLAYSLAGRTQLSNLFSKEPGEQFALWQEILYPSSELKNKKNGRFAKQETYCVNHPVKYAIWILWSSPAVKEYDEIRESS